MQPYKPIFNMLNALLQT